MKTFYLHKAQPVIRDVDSESATLHFHDEIKSSPDVDTMRELFHHEAEIIEKTLRDALPGGTYDQLVGLMLQRKASHFIVSHNR